MSNTGEERKIAKSKDLYPDVGGSRWFAAVDDYQPIVDSFGTVFYQVDDQDYQGDTRVVYKDGNRIGVLIFGWGSCSGCDALQACGSHDDIDKLIEELYESISWFENVDDAIDYFEHHDWKGDWSWYSSQQKLFVEKATEMLKTLRDGDTAGE